MSSEDEDKSLYVPLMGSDDESPRQKKNRIIDEFVKSHFYLMTITDQLTSECLGDIESLSESYIEAIVRSSFTVPAKKFRNRNSFNAFCSKFSQLGEKTKKVVAALGFKLHKEGEGNYMHHFTDEFVFFHADQLAKKSANYGRTRKFFFYLSKRYEVNLIMQRIVSILTPPSQDVNPNFQLNALQGDELEKYKQACLSLEQFPRPVIRAFFKNLYSVPADQQERREEIVAAADKIAEAIDLVITHKDSKHLFPNLTLFFAQTVIRQNFGQSLSAMSLKSFQAALVNIKSAKQLESLIRCLVYEVEISTFKGKYEDMLELCLIKLMEFSDPKEGLNLDPELLKKCLSILNNYFWASNIRKFLRTPDTKHRPECRAQYFPLFYFIQRRLREHHSVFDNYPKINALTVDYTVAFDPEYPQTVKDFLRLLTGTFVRFNVQALFQKYLLTYPDSPVTTLLMTDYGADKNAVMDNGKRLLLWLIEENGVLQGQGDTYNKFSDAINVLLHNGVTVAEEDVEAAEKINTTEGRHLLGRLVGKLREQPQVVKPAASEKRGKGKEEEREVFVDRAVPVDATVVLNEKLQRAVNLLDVDEVQELLAKGANVRVLGPFSKARQFVYMSVDTDERLKRGRNICGQLQQAYGALANVPNLDSVTRLRRLLDAEQYEMDINNAIMEAGPLAIEALSVREVRKLCNHRLTQQVLGFVRENVKSQRDFDLFWALRENDQPILTLIQEACEDKNYGLAYVLLRVLPDSSDENFLKDTSNFKEILLKIISEEEEKARKSSVLQTDRKRWAESARGMVKTLYNHIFPKVEDRAVVVDAMVARDQQQKRRNSLSDLNAAQAENKSEVESTRARAGSVGK